MWSSMPCDSSEAKYANIILLMHIKMGINFPVTTHKTNLCQIEMPLERLYARYLEKGMKRVAKLASTYAKI